MIARYRRERRTESLARKEEGCSAMLVKVFVGLAANGEDQESQCVLEWSLKKHSSLPVHITWMSLSKDRDSPFYSNGSDGWRTNLWSTPFSGLRWLVPELCNFQGRALYVDSDVIFLADVAELWNQEFQPGKCVLAKGGSSWRFCVSLWDCAASYPNMMPAANLQADPSAHKYMVERFRRAPFVQSFEGNWNYCDNEDVLPLDHPSVKLVHYTDMSTQPHLRYAIPRLALEGKKHWYDGPMRKHLRPEIVHLFDQYFQEAQAQGYSPDRYKNPNFGAYRKMVLTHYNGGGVR